MFDLAVGPLCVSMPAYDDHWSLQVLSENADNVASRVRGVIVLRWLVRGKAESARLDRSGERRRSPEPEILWRRSLLPFAWDAT